MFRRLLVVLLLSLVGVFLLPSPTAQTANVTAHYIANTSGTTQPFALGFNVADTSYHPSVVNALPSGVRALVWIGQKCPTTADSTFKSRINALVGNSKVFGFYLSDEPHIADCPGGPTALATRADYIRSVFPAAKSFIVLSKVADFKPFRPAVTHVDLVGLNPYPCSIANPQCDIRKIGERVTAATGAGIPLSAIVPVYQAFGQENTTSHYYNLPTATQMKAMLDEWRRLVPSPVLDYTYSWNNQSSSNPTLVNSPSLQGVFRDWFAGTTTSPGC